MTQEVIDPQTTEKVRTDPTVQSDANSSSTPIKEDTYEVRMNSYQIVSIAGITAVHNEIAFYCNGKPILAFNGNAHDNQTGELNTFAITPGHTLRISAADKAICQNADTMKLLASIPLEANMNREVFLEKLLAVAAASAHINGQKLEYVVVGGVGFEAQNSNSVAATLVQAMGYQYPESEMNRFWAPGSKRLLLPSNWQPNLSPENLIESILNLNTEFVVRQVRNENNLPVERKLGQSYSPNLYDTSKDKISGQNAEQSPLIKVSIDVSGSFSQASTNTAEESVETTPAGTLVQPAVIVPANTPSH